MTRDELIAALEAATGPSRELDAKIWYFVDPNDYREKCVFRGFTYGGEKYTPDQKRQHTSRMAARYACCYTASIDAALTLMPEDTRWAISVPRQPDMSGKRYWASTRSNLPGVRGSTPAIALCIAALKA